MEGTVHEPVTIVTSDYRRRRLDITTYPDHCGDFNETGVESDGCELELWVVEKLNE